MNALEKGLNREFRKLARIDFIEESNLKTANYANFARLRRLKFNKIN